MKWSDEPNIDEVQQVMISIGKVKAQLKLLDNQIEQKSIKIKKEHSRSPWLIREDMPDFFEQKAELEAQLAELEAQKDFLNYHKDMYKTNGYMTR